MTSVTGLNNNEYQIARGQVLNRNTRLDKTCNFVKLDLYIHRCYDLRGSSQSRAENHESATFKDLDSGFWILILCFTLTP
ncbi:unnamed protein product [Camellia sinensis]